MRSRSTWSPIDPYFIDLGPGRVDGDHAPHRRDVGIVRDRLEPAAHAASLRVERVEHDAGFHDDVVAADRDDLAKMPAQVDDQPRRRASRRPCRCPRRAREREIRFSAA